MNLTPARIALLLSTCLLMAVSTGSGQTSGSSGGSFGIRGGVGTDVELGLGFGAGVSYLWASNSSSTAFELGADVYYSHTTESYTDQRGSVTVNGEDVTTLLVFGIRGNALFNFRPSKKSVHFIVGIGFVVASMQWEETENAPNWTATFVPTATLSLAYRFH